MFLVIQCLSTSSCFFNPRPEYFFLLFAVIQPEPMFFFLYRKQPAATRSQDNARQKHTDFVNPCWRVLQATSERIFPS